MLNTPRPKLAIIPGDPSGIGPELIAKLLTDNSIHKKDDILLIGDRHIWEQGASQAHLPCSLHTIEENDIPTFSGVAHLDLNTLSPRDVRIAQVTKAGGETSLRCLDKALDLALKHHIDGILFAPFNKAAMTKAGLNAEDEHRYIARYIGWTDYHSEINVLDEFMTTRVTSHIPLKDVASHINQEAIIRAVNLADKTLKRAGFSRPAIAVAALNPHAGDNGKFGHEDNAIIKPAVKTCQEQQMNVTGPWPSDTVFLKALKKEVDAVVTMYHDQGQIAVKLLGFERGATIVGGIPIPIVTPAHGTAFDIAGHNKAHVGATRHALKILSRMVRSHPQPHHTSPLA